MFFSDMMILKQIYSFGLFLRQPTTKLTAQIPRNRKGLMLHALHLLFLSDLLQPVPPCVSLRESVQVYKEHCRMAREFHQVKNEIAVLEDRK